MPSATCNNCKHHFRVPEGEEQDHACPKCGWAPWLEGPECSCDDCISNIENLENEGDEE